ncbi:unnamed protein product, partial [Staurois parvus]
MSARSCDQLCPITADHMALMISVALEVPPVSVHQCQLSALNSATCQCPSVPHISAYQCTSMPHISDHLSCPSVPPISAASQCHLTVPYISDACQCPSVPPTSTSSSV